MLALTLDRRNFAQLSVPEHDKRSTSKRVVQRDTDPCQRRCVDPSDQFGESRLRHGMQSIAIDHRVSV